MSIDDLFEELKDVNQEEGKTGDEEKSRIFPQRVFLVLEPKTRELERESVDSV